LVWKVETKMASTSSSLAPGESKGEWKTSFGLESENKDGVYLVISGARRKQGEWKTRFGLEGVYVVMSAPGESKDDWSGLVWHSKQRWRLPRHLRRQEKSMDHHSWFRVETKMASIAWHPRSMEKARMTYGVPTNILLYEETKIRVNNKIARGFCLSWLAREWGL
jgi:hypothetical protein